MSKPLIRNQVWRFVEGHVVTVSQQPPTAVTFVGAPSPPRLTQLCGAGKSPLRPFPLSTLNMLTYQVRATAELMDFPLDIL